MSALAGLALAAALLAAQGREERSIQVEEVTLEARSAWPDGLSFGSFPIHVELENEGAEEAQARVLARHQFLGDELEKRLVLAPGERRAFDLVCRAVQSGWNDYVLELEVDGRQGDVVSLGPDQIRSRSPSRALLALAAERPREARYATWEAALALGELALGGAGFEDMPDAHAAWSSLDAVLLDTGGGLPPAERLAPLVAWTRLGGTLVLYGERAAAAARGEPSLAAWLEPRFRTLEDPSLAAGVYVFGQGQLVTIDTPALFERPGEAPLIAARIARGARPWTPGAEDSRAEDLMPQGSPAAELPLRAFAALLLAFAVLIGPVNFWLVKRRGRPVLLLLTVPGSALVFSALLLAYGVLAQGLDVKVVRRSFTVLDQRLHQASTADLQRVFAGSSPGPGLQPAPGTAVHLAADRDPFGGYARPRAERTRADLTGAPLLAGDYLPVRRVHEVVTLTDAPARGRLELVAKGGALEVANGLGAELRWLVLRDAAGGWHALDEPLGPGASAALVPVDGGEGRMWSERLVEPLLGDEIEALPPGSYAGELARSPFVDDCGVERNELDARHWVLGVLEPEGAGR